MDILKKCPPFQNKYNIERIIKKSEYRIYTYDEVIADETSKATKIKKGDYLESGKYPIVDQGQEFIGGYSNELEGLYEKIPFIIFGDHTRTIKYIDFPSFIGADGVKVLNVKEDMLQNLDIKYIYYYLIYSDIPNNGYSRHFKYIKKLLYIVPPMETQKQIVEVLDEAQKLIDTRKEQIKLLDDLIESVFYDMFGDPIKNEKGFDVGTIKDMTSYTQYGTSKKADDHGEFPIIRMGNLTYRGNWDFTDLKYIDLDEKEKEKYLIKKGDLLFNRTNSRELVGKTAVYKEDKTMAFAGYLIKLEPNELGNSEYISAYLNSKHGKLTLLNMAKSIVGMANINAQELQGIKILIPPLSIQNQFAQKVEAIESQKQAMEQSLKLMEDNYKNLMQRAFKGDLF